MLNIYNLDTQVVANELLKNRILAAVREGTLVIMSGNTDQAQSVVDKLYYRMPDLLPVQFYFMLAKSGLDHAINTLLPPLQLEDLNKYAMYKAYLTGASYYEFSKALAMYTDIKDKILLVDDTLDFTEQQLKDMWNEAKTI